MSIGRTSMTAQRQNILLAFLCVTLWASTASMVRLSQHSLDHYQFLFWSSVFSLMTVGLISAVKGTLLVPLHYRKNDWLLAIIIGFLGTFLYYLLLFNGLSEGKSINVIIIQYTWPLMFSFISILFFKEKLSWQKVLATFLGVFAVVIVLSKGHLMSFSLHNPVLLGSVAFGAFCFAIFNLGMKHFRA